MSKRILKIVYIFICLIIILSKECYGYLDPSSMTYLIQMIAAVCITVTTSIGVILFKIRKFFMNKKNEKVTENEDLNK